MNNRYYLAYGMNTNLDSMRWRCPKAKSLGVVTLPDHSLVFKGCCDVIKTPGLDMECALWTITDDCERSLDALEGYPYLYTKKEVNVRWRGRTIRPMIYYMNPGDKFKEPSQFYLDMVVNGYKDHDMDIDQIYRALEQLLEVQ